MVVAQDWKPVSGHIATKWAAEVTPQNAWPQYPRPTLQREAWQNLNGLWEYAITAGNAAMPAAADGRILVPFAVESSLSGVGKALQPDQRLWYRRTFAVPVDWAGKDVLLHFEAVDWECEAWVDGVKVGEHRGGYDPFTFDVTASLAAGGGEHTLLVGVRDPSDQGAQPRGKQVLKPSGIWYTPTSGIWQTVWLEPVAKTHITAVRCESLGVDKVRVHVEVANAQPGDRWGLLQFPGFGIEEQDMIFTPRVAGLDATMDVAVPPWGPGQPHLETLGLTLERDGETLDKARTYVANRQLSVGKDTHGTTRLLLNGEPLFQFGPLDQGFWPDGIYTPPSYEAMCADLDTIAAMGCNMLRKHVKVESQLFYSECDRRGILVWQDMPSGETQKDPANFERELRAMIATHEQFPSIVMWVVFNEGWGQHDTRRYVDLVRQLDPTRWTGNASGWTDQKCGDVIDLHSYPGPAMLPAEAHRASVLGEYGGLGLPIEGHTWVDKNNWGYVSFKDSKELTEQYVARIEQLRPLIAQGLCAAVYTQTTDVEVECNGWLTYDRAVQKVAAVAAAQATRQLYEPPGTIRTIVPTAQVAPQPWRWTESEPGRDWEQPGFDDSLWQAGKSGFGSQGTPGSVIGTEWKTDAIWLRRTIELPAAPMAAPQWCVHHDEDVEVFVDGKPALQLKRYTTSYQFVPVSAEAKALLTPGKHVLAVHCRQTGGGQYIDVGISEFVAGQVAAPVVPGVDKDEVPGPQPTVECFPLRDVRLLDGELKVEQESMHGYLLQEDLDALLFNFRKNADLPTPGRPLSGWESPDCELRGHYTGHFLSALALMYASTGDARLLQRGAALVDGLGKCQDKLSGGYLSAFPSSFMERLAKGERVWAPWYTLHKVGAGLLDQYLLCGSEPALVVAKRFAGWMKAFTDPLDDAAMQRMLGTEFGGMQAFLADLYAISGDGEHLALARRFTHQAVFEPLSRGEDQLKGLHANTQIPKLIAAARLFELTGEAPFGAAARFFFDQVTQHRCYATGGTSSYEYWRDAPDKLDWQLSSQDAENCCTHNLLKLGRELWRLQPDAKYADYYERALWNGILGTKCPDDPAAIMYYVPMQSGLFRFYSGRENGYVCCSGTGIESFSKLGDFVYGRNGEGVYVNLFVPSVVTWEEKGVRIQQETVFPEQQGTRILVDCTQPTRMKLRVRRPAWCGDGFGLRLNGERIEAAVGGDGYAVIDREWRAGDRVDVALPMALRREPLGDNRHVFAVCYGPLVLAERLGTKGMSEGMKKGQGDQAYRMVTEGAAAELGAAMGLPDRDATAEQLSFIWAPHRRLVPFYRLHGERYAVYFQRGNMPGPGTRLRDPDEDTPLFTGAVLVGEPQTERRGSFQAWHSERGESHGRKWVRSDLQFRYDLDLVSGQDNVLEVRFARDEDSKRFELLVDGVVVATPEVKPPVGDEPLFVQEIPLPRAATDGKRRVAVAFRALKDAPRRTPRVFGLAMKAAQ